MGFTRIFRSRWAALFWAGGIVWTAYDVATANAPDSRAPTARATPSTTGIDATGAPVDPKDAAALASAMGD